ncbi:MAG: hypothetical protein FWD16_07105, partial [Clostridia bacterium]|nr:hypothetical protein [Clostridia bacterium]
ITFEPMGSNTMVLLQVIDNPGIEGFEIHFQVPEDKAFIEGSGKSYVKGAIAKADYVPATKTVKFLFLSTLDKDSGIYLEDKNPVLCSFELAGTVSSIELPYIGGEYKTAEKIDNYIPVQPPTPRKGDANCDGSVDVNDILLVRDVIFGIAKLTPQGRRNLNLEPAAPVNVDHILFIRDCIFGEKK